MLTKSNYITGIQCSKLLWISKNDKEKFNSVEFGIKLVYAINKLYPKQLKFRNEHFNRLIGNNITIKKIRAGIKPEEIILSWTKELNDFKKIRNKYLFY